VYRMLGKGGEALYVGKARDLKKRVATYFQKHVHSPRTQMMVSQGVVGRNDEGGIRSLRARLDEQFKKGRLHGFASALELLYERR